MDSAELKGLTVPQLRAECKRRGLGGYSDLTRPRLLEYLETGSYPPDPKAGRRGGEGLSRREVTLAMLSAVAVRLVDGSWLAVRGLGESAAQWGEKQLLHNIVDLDGPLQFFAGSTNKLAATEGKDGPSPYVRLASRNLVAFAQKFGARNLVEVPPEDSRLLLEAPHNDLVLIGGPVANDLYATVSGHAFREVQRDGESVRVPEFDPDCGLRWGFEAGVLDDGEDELRGGSSGRERRRRLAKRYDESGNLVQRPLYGIRDVTEKEPILMRRDRDGFLQQDGLLISRIPNPLHPERNILLLGGVHGYSVAAFGRDLTASLERMQRIIGEARIFQLWVPADLKHFERYTRATLRWDQGQLQPLRRDYRGKRFTA